MGFVTGKICSTKHLLTGHSRISNPDTFTMQRTLPSKSEIQLIDDFDYFHISRKICDINEISVKN